MYFAKLKATNKYIELDSYFFLLTKIVEYFPCSCLW